MKRLLLSCATFLLVAQTAFAGATTVDFEAFKIRNADGSITAPWDASLSVIENAAGDGASAVVEEAGQKAGYGTNAFDGMQINQLISTDYTIADGGSGTIPYLNIWVTDGTNYATIATAEQDWRGTYFSTRDMWKIYEFSDNTSDPAAFDWLFDSGDGDRINYYLTNEGTRVTLADISDSVIICSKPGAGPTYPAYVGTGAARGGFGFNVIFGDTLANYNEAYTISDLTVSFCGSTYEAGNTAAVPEPTTWAMLVVGTFAASALRRRRR